MIRRQAQIARLRSDQATESLRPVENLMVRAAAVGRREAPGQAPSMREDKQAEHAGNRE